jgi:uncharacterized protein (TIGR00369 family)
MSMLTRIQALRRDGAFARIGGLIPYAEWLGLETCETDGGLLTRLRFQDSHIGNTDLPAIHGGLVAALLEHAALLHYLWAQQPAVLPKTINISVDYLRPSGPRDILARAEITKRGRRIANLRAEAWQDDPARPVAAAHAHLLVG